jgi:hypothetical protein
LQLILSFRLTYHICWWQTPILLLCQQVCWYASPCLLSDLTQLNNVFYFKESESLLQSWQIPVVRSRPKLRIRLTSRPFITIRTLLVFISSACQLLICWISAPYRLSVSAYVTYSCLFGCPLWLYSPCLKLSTTVLYWFRSCTFDDICRRLLHSRYAVPVSLYDGFYKLKEIEGTWTRFIYLLSRENGEISAKKFSSLTTSFPLTKRGQHGTCRRRALFLTSPEKHLWNCDHWALA